MPLQSFISGSRVLNQGPGRSRHCATLVRKCSRLRAPRPHALSCDLCLLQRISRSHVACRCGLGSGWACAGHLRDAFDPRIGAEEPVGTSRRRLCHGKIRAGSTSSYCKGSHSVHVECSRVSVCVCVLQLATCGLARYSRLAPGRICFAAGMVLNIALGPILDVSGYAFAPASVIAPFTGFNIIVNSLPLGDSS